MGKRALTVWTGAITKPGCSTLAHHHVARFRRNVRDCYANEIKRNRGRLFIVHPVS
jgi:hypothetical protein